MSDYHAFICERCKAVAAGSCANQTGVEVPKGWKRIQVFSEGRNHWPEKTLDFCANCWGEIQRLIGRPPTQQP